MALLPVTTHDQILRVVALAEPIWRDHYTPIIGSAQVAYMLARFQSPAAIAEQIATGTSYHLLRCDDADAGYCAWRLEPDALFLSKLYVLDGHRGRGLARLAVAAAMQAASQQGLAVIRLTVNRANATAIGAYRRLGFSISRDVRADIGNGFVMDDHEMVRSL